MPKICYLHSGMHKTGSSSIQESLHAASLSNPVYLKETKDIKCQNGKIPVNHSGLLYAVFSKDRYTNPTFLQRGQGKEDIDEMVARFSDFLEQFFSTTSADVIISGEGVVRLKDDEFKALITYLKKYFEKVVIIAYIRSPWSFMNSALQQRVKGGLKRLNPNSLYPRYRDRFEAQTKAVPSSDIRFFKFDPATFPKGDIVRDFAKRIDTSIPENAIIKTNESLSLEACSLLFTHNKLYKTKPGPTVLTVREFMFKALSPIGTSKIRLARRVITPILDAHAEDLAWMEDKLGDSLAEDLPEPGPNDIASENDLMRIALESTKDLKNLLDQKQITHKLDARVSSPQDIADSIENLRAALSKEYDELRASIGPGRAKKVILENV